MTHGVQRDRVLREYLWGAASFTFERDAARELNAASGRTVKYDIVGGVARAAGITRRSAADVLSRIHPDRFALFRLNPEEFIVRAGKLVVEQKARMVVEHIKIPTPVGDYAPDWVIAFDEQALGGSVKHIFLVAETKGSLSSLALRGVEESKIECVRKLFNDMSKMGVRYHHVASYQDLLDAMSC